jgi:NAD(P)H-dependent FMN reductase
MSTTPDQYTSAPNIAIIIGSTRHGRFAGTVANWFVEHAKGVHDGFIDVIDLAETTLPAVMGTPDTPGLVDFRERIAAADMFVIITPEYNHSYPAALKHALDSAFMEWHGKPVAFVSYGGTSGGIRAVEQLRQVASGLHMADIRETVTFPLAWTQFDEDGRPHEEATRAQAATTMLAQLRWWGDALSAARTVKPYVLR